MIGARRATHAGRERAHAIARELAAAGIVVVSGLALGTDAAAHAGALAGKGVTLAFTGTGTDVVYPRRHAPLAPSGARSRRRDGEASSRSGTRRSRGAFRSAIA